VRRDVAFASCGLLCRGWLYTPDNLRAGARAPALALAHGFSAVKEQYLANFAERFAAAGFVTLVFDYRFLGASEGEPRGQVLPLEQAEDYRNALTWLSRQPQVDPERLGIWGTSMSGGIVLWVAEYDKRVKAVVAQVPAAVNWETRQRSAPERFAFLGKLALEDRLARYGSGAVNYLKVVAPEGELCALPPADAYDWFVGSHDVAPNWRNEVTLASLEKYREFDPVSLIHTIAPVPLLMIVAEKDSLLPYADLLAAYARAGEPKALLPLPCGHFDLYYREPWFGQACGAALAWFKEHLGSG
jgi:uncharacterized protein